MASNTKINDRPLFRTALAVVIGIALGGLSLPMVASPAHSLDLFGDDGDEDTPPEGVFWKEKSDAPPIQPIGVPNSFADLAEQVSPAVVNIRTSSTVQGASFPFGHGDFFDNPFQRRGGPAPQPREFKQQGEGSGFVISPEGYIVTNAHVVREADTITVMFLDGKELDAEVVGYDEKTDIALIKVDSEDDLSAIPLGDSDEVRPGEWVVAIGNPYGLEHTVTAGIVSATNRRTAHRIAHYENFIQTDAAINPGNSGGPLINLAGEVIGINTAINPAANTIGFTVPINMAKQILPQLRSEGYVTRGWLGVQIQPVTRELAENFGTDSGALVTDVISDTPAEKAGFKRGDVIVEFDGKPIADNEELPIIVASTPVDKKVTVVVIRNKERKSMRVKLGAMEEPRIATNGPGKGNLSTFGLAVQDLTPEIANQLGMEADHGVVVTSVEPRSPAGEAGLQRGDVIIEVDRNEIDNTGALKKQLSSADESVLLLIRRRDATIFVPMRRAG